MISDKKLRKRGAYRVVEELAYFVVGGALGVLILIVGVMRMSRDKILPIPKVLIGGVEVSGMSRDEASIRLAKKIDELELKLSFNGVNFVVPHDIFVPQIERAIDEAMALPRNITPSRIGEMLRGRVVIPLPYTIEFQKYDEYLGELKESIEIATNPASVKFDKKGEAVVTNGEDGVVVDEERLRQELGLRIEMISDIAPTIPTKVEHAYLNPEGQTKLLAVANSLKKKSLEILVDEEKVKLNQNELVSFLAVEPQLVGQINTRALEEYVRGVAESYARAPQDARFEFVGGRVKEFAPARDGLEVEIGPTSTGVKAGLQKLIAGENETTIEATVTRTPPKISTGEVNDLGIRELIGRGESYYSHSIPNRVYNVGLAASRVTGALVPPGGEFSFNEFVGEISGATGYKTAYVISGGRTVLGDGGGVCQVSTTLFRAAMDAGLPITERWAHAYRVGYYEQNSEPGIDATVYSPSKDFRFVNNTGSYILIQAINDAKNRHLVFEIYGADDGRVASVSKVKVWGVTPPLPDRYEDDPSLSSGEIKQVDWAAWGATTSFEYKVTRNGETVFEKTYTSGYRPWANVYLRGSGQ